MGGLAVLFRFAGNHHRVAEGEKAVSFFHGLLIDGQRVFAAHQRGDEHEQRALRQVEVGDERVHSLDLHAGGDENLGEAAAGVHDAVLRRDGFQRAHARCADADDAAAARAGGVNRVRLFRRDFVIFAVHMVVGHVFLFDGSECAQTDVQQHGHDVDALPLDFFEQFRRKVQAGRRRGSAAVHLGIDGLVARLIFQFFVDIRRQGHLAEAVEHILEHALIEEAHGAPAVFAQHGKRAALRRASPDSCLQGIQTFEHGLSDQEADLEDFWQRDLTGIEDIEVRTGC